jgi:predicted DNA-binding ribbon-helix-helix protein
MPSSAVGKLVRRGRPPSRPTAVRSVRLPVETWKRLESEASAANTTVNALIARRVG